MRAELPRGLTKITNEEDIYRIGTLCQAKVIYDKHNTFAPYALNLFFVEKAKIQSFFIKIEAQKFDLKKKIDRCNKKIVF